MDYNESNEDGTYTIVYQKVADSTELLAVTRLLARTLTETPYMTVEDFLNSLSDSDLQSLMEITELDEEDDENGERKAELILIAEMLAKAEGLESGDIDKICERVNILTSFLAIESLDRKEFVKAIRKNMSFGEDMRTKIIAEKIPGLDYGSFTGSLDE